MPESRYKYLYERLGDQDFQLLVSALLTIRFPDFVPMPLRQADGARDGLRMDGIIVYQSKWLLEGQHKDSVAWLDSAIRREAEAIKRLVASGVKKYFIVTNVPSTGRAKTGTYDRLDAKLKAYSEEFGLDMSALWREAVDGMVDSADNEVKWAYAEMLAGWDLIRYLVSEHIEGHRSSSLRNVVRRVASVQWERDKRIKFTQAEMDHELLDDLFVDVPAERVQIPWRVAEPPKDPDAVGGAGDYLIRRAHYPFTLVRGVPGQGKSTLGQHVCQALRASFMPQAGAGERSDQGEVRFPLRFDLSDYAQWIQGRDVFGDADDSPNRKRRKRPASESTIECFVADLMSHASGDNNVSAADVQTMLERLPALLVMDGLDEVGKVSSRNRVVEEINAFCARGGTYSVPPRVIVTTRPNSSGLAEPDHSRFEVISLRPLGHALRDQYLRNWCGVYGVVGEEARTLRRNFNEKTKEPYIGELADNPMQLTILLSLIRQNGDATPNQRTELYDYYMRMLLAREANKYPDSVRKHRAELIEIMPFLGWYIQSRAEEDGRAGRMPRGEVEAAMKHFQRTYEKSESIVDELFQAATDRLWALTSKEEGTFEFEVLSLREYFAAQFLHSCAGEGVRHFDKTVVFRELLKRPFWMNTVRFYAGNATGTEVYSLTAGVAQELAANPSKQVVVSAWTLVTDGVFNSRPAEAQEVVDSLTHDQGSSLLLDAFDDRQVVPLPDPAFGDKAWKRLTESIAADPESPENLRRVRVMRELCGRRSAFRDWWIAQTRGALGQSCEAAWLRIGASCEVLAGDDDSALPGLSAASDDTAQMILNTGLDPRPNTAIRADLLDAVLAGHCAETCSAQSTIAQVAVAINPREFHWLATGATPRSDKADGLRARAIQKLREDEPALANVAKGRRFRRGEKGTTLPWSRVATELRAVVGRCWLVSEIAVIGAASPLRNGFSLLPGTEAFGPNGTPATLIAQTRMHRGDAEWWMAQRERCIDELSQAEWAFALSSIADSDVVSSLRDERAQVVGGLQVGLRRSLRLAEGRMVEAQGWSSGASAISSALTKDGGPSRVGRSPEPLAVVARREKWLKVDSTPAYR